MEQRICIFGDSTSQGYNDINTDGWAYKIKKELLGIDQFHQLYNLSISGATSDHLVDRFEIEAKHRRPHLIIFAIGGNDASYLINEKTNIVSQEKFKKNLEKLTSMARKWTDNILFIGLTPADESLTDPLPWDTNQRYINKHISAYDEIIHTWCVDENIVYIPMMNSLNKKDLDDGCHPSPQGHEKMYQAIRGPFFEAITQNEKSA